MLGWMIVFALLALLGAARSLANPAVASSMVGILFALLFVLCLVTRVMRGRAW